MKKIIPVLSLGRSGSSLLTKGLQALNINLGDTIFNLETSINAKGHWEEIEISLLSELVFREIGLEKYKVGQLNDKDLLKIPEHLWERACSVIQERTNASPLFGFKDVNFWKILPFWKRVFKEIKTNPTYIIAARNPISVAESFKKMGLNNPGRIYILWLESVTTMLTETEGESRVVVEYDQLIEHPTLQIQRIADEIGIKRTEINRAALEDYSSSFLEKDLRHHTATTEKTLEIPYMPTTISECYELLQKMGSDQLNEHPTQVKDFLREAKRKVGDISTISAAIYDLERSLAATSTAIENSLLLLHSRISDAQVASNIFSRKPGPDN